MRDSPPVIKLCHVLSAEKQHNRPRSIRRGVHTPFTIPPQAVVRVRAVSRWTTAQGPVPSPQRPDVIGGRSSDSSHGPAVVRVSVGGVHASHLIAGDTWQCFASFSVEIRA